MDTILTNARIVLADQVVEGSLHLRDGKIAGIDSGVSSLPAAEDMGGDYVIPGLIELHTDHLENHYAPRPKVRWNPVAAVCAHDAQIAASGITTVFDALRVGLDEDTDITDADMRRLADAIEAGMAKDRLRADHFIHLRCEVSAPNCLESFEVFENDPLVRIASLMDHSPGQRQFVSLEAYAVYYKGKRGMSDAEFNEFCERRMAQSAEWSDNNRRILAERARARGVVLASHDDATNAHVEEAVELGIRVAEFPTTLEAARASKAQGLAVLMGAPMLSAGARIRAMSRRAISPPMACSTSCRPTTFPSVSSSRPSFSARWSTGSICRSRSPWCPVPRPALPGLRIEERSPSANAPISCGCGSRNISRSCARSGAKVAGWSERCRGQRRKGRGR